MLPDMDLSPEKELIKRSDARIMSESADGVSDTTYRMLNEPSLETRSRK